MWTNIIQENKLTIAGSENAARKRLITQTVIVAHTGTESHRIITPCAIELLSR
jgi:hypothetical protein